MNQEALNAKIEAFVAEHKEDLLRYLQELVAIPSVSAPATERYPYGEGCAQALDAALRMGNELGFATKNFDSYYGTVTLQKGPEGIGLFAHLDVVPPGENWTGDPYVCRMEQGFLVGRGTNDDKGPAVALLLAMACCKELDLPLKHSLMLFLGCEEEQSMSDIQRYVQETPHLPVFSLISDGKFPVSFAEKGIFVANLETNAPLRKIVSASAGEVSNMVPDQAGFHLRDVSLEEVGTFLEGSGFTTVQMGELVQVSCKGSAAHAAKPDGSVNAIRILCQKLMDAPFLQEDAPILRAVAGFLSDCYGEGISIPAADKETGRLTHIAGMMSVTESGTLHLNFNIRYPATASGEVLAEGLQKAAAAQNFTLADYRLNPPGWFDPAHPIVEKLTGIYNTFSGDCAEPYTDAAATYARKLPAAVCFGPHFPNHTIPFADGRGKEHMPDECVSVDDLLMAIKIYVHAILAIDALF